MKVYVSSSFVDLQVHRSAVIETLRGTGFEPQCMEEYVAEPQIPVKKCLRHVAECDAYVGLVAWRYGYVPDGFDYSITELEYLQARKKAIPVFLFLLDEKAEWDASLRDDPPTLVRRFRAKLQKRHLVQFFRTPEDAGRECLRALTKHLGVHDSARKHVNQAPPLPNHFVERPEAVAQLKERLLRKDQSPGVLVVSALHGLGGIGKSMLAAKLAHDPAIRKRFPDGVLWATLGQEPQTLSLLLSWIDVFPEARPEVTDVRRAAQQLRSALHDRACLLVIDDAWNPADVEHFLSGGPRCRVLVTTRDASVVPSAEPFDLELMSPEQAVELLERRARRPLAPPETEHALAVASAVGYLPLALELSAAQTESLTWDELAQELQSEMGRLELREGDDLSLPEAMRATRLSVRGSLNLSLRLLNQTGQERFAWLGAAPEDALLTPASAAVLWGVDEREARLGLNALRKKALLQRGPVQGATRTFRLHDLLRDLAQSLLTQPASRPAGDGPPGLGLAETQAHGIILERMRNRANGVWHHLPFDGYSHRYLSWHLQKAGQRDELHALLAEETGDRRNGWYAACAQHGNVSYFLDDVQTAWRAARSDGDLQASFARECRYALILSSVNSLAASLPPILLSELVRRGIWSGSQALAFARRMQDARQRADAIGRILGTLPEDLRSDAARDAIDAAKSIVQAHDRQEVVRELVLRCLDQKLWAQALASAEVMDEASAQGKVLLRVAAAAPEPFTTQALCSVVSAASRSLKFEWSRSQLLTEAAGLASADFLPEILACRFDGAGPNRDVLQAVGKRAVALGHLPLVQQAAKGLDGSLRRELLTSAIEGTGPGRPKDVLQLLTDEIVEAPDREHCETLILQALQVVPARFQGRFARLAFRVPGPALQAQLATAIMPSVPPAVASALCRQAFRCVERVKSEPRRQRVLLDLIAVVPAEQRQHLFKLCDDFTDPARSGAALLRLLGTAQPEWRDDLVQQVAAKASEASGKAGIGILSGLLAFLVNSGLTERAFECLESRSDLPAPDRVKLLADVLPRLRGADRRRAIALLAQCSDSMTDESEKRRLERLLQRYAPDETARVPSDPRLAVREARRLAHHGRTLDALRMLRESRGMGDSRHLLHEIILDGPGLLQWQEEILAEIDKFPPQERLELLEIVSHSAPSAAHPELVQRMQQAASECQPPVRESALRRVAVLRLRAATDDNLWHAAQATSDGLMPKIEKLHLLARRAAKLSAAHRADLLAQIDGEDDPASRFDLYDILRSQMDEMDWADRLLAALTAIEDAAAFVSRLHRAVCVEAPTVNPRLAPLLQRFVLQAGTEQLSQVSRMRIDVAELLANAAKQVPDPEQQVTKLFAIAQPWRATEAGMMDRVLAAVRELTDPETRTRLLLQLRTTGRSDVDEALLDAAEKLPESKRVATYRELAATDAAHVGDRLLDACRRLVDVELRRTTLLAVLSSLPKNLIDGVVTIVDSLPDRVRAATLLEIMSWCSEADREALLRRAVTATRQVERLEERVESLEKLVLASAKFNLGEIAIDTLAMIASLDYANRVPIGLLEKCLTQGSLPFDRVAGLVAKCNDTAHRTALMNVVASHLNESALRKLLEHTQGIKDNGERLRVCASLAGTAKLDAHLPSIVEEALSNSDDHAVAEALRSVTSIMPADVAREVIERIQGATTEDAQIANGTGHLEAILERLCALGHVTEAKRLVQIGLGSDGRESLVTSIAAYVDEPEILDAAVRAVRAIGDPARRLDQLIRLAPYLREEQQLAALEATYRFTDPQMRFRAIRAIASHLGPAAMRHAVADANEVGDRTESLKRLAVLSRYISGEERSQLFVDALAIDLPFDRVQALCSLLPELSPAERKRAIDAACDTLRQIDEPTQLAEALAGSAALIDQDRLHELIELAVRICCQTDNARKRVESFRIVSPVLLRLRTDQLLPLLRDSLERLAVRHRRCFLDDLEALSPAIVSIGPDCSQALYDAIVDVGNWWP